VPTQVKAEEIKLAKQVIGTFEGKLNLADYHDEYRDGLMTIIEAKIAGEEIVAPAVEAPLKVVNLMEALKKSLNAVSARKKKPAKAALPRVAAAREAKRRRA
jgi:DNA end-binding protein Ku